MSRRKNQISTPPTGLPFRPSLKRLNTASIRRFVSYNPVAAMRAPTRNRRADCHPNASHTAMPPATPSAPTQPSAWFSIAFRSCSVKSLNGGALGSVMSLLLIGIEPRAGSIFALRHDDAKHLYKSRRGAQDQARNINPVLVQPLVQPGADQPPDHRCYRKHECKLNQLFHLDKGLHRA